MKKSKVFYTVLGLLLLLSLHSVCAEVVLTDQEYEILLQQLDEAEGALNRSGSQLTMLQEQVRTLQTQLQQASIYSMDLQTQLQQATKWSQKLELELKELKAISPQLQMELELLEISLKEQSKEQIIKNITNFFIGFGMGTLTGKYAL